MARFFNLEKAFSGMQNHYTPNEYIVLSAYAYFSNNHKGECFPSMETVANMCGISRKTAIAAQKALVKKGVISIRGTRSNGKQGVNIVTILDPELVFGNYPTPKTALKAECKNETQSGKGLPNLHTESAENDSTECKKGISQSVNFTHELNNNNNYINNINNYNSLCNDFTHRPIISEIEPNKPSTANTAIKTKTDSSNISLKAKKELSNNCPPSSVAPPKFYDETSGDELWRYIESDDSGINLGTLKTMCSGYGTFLKRNYKIEPTTDNLKAIVNRFCKWKADSEVPTVFNPAKAFKEMTKSTNTFEFFAAELNRADKPSGSGGQKGSSSKVELKTTYKGDSQMPIYLVSHYEQGIPVLKERPEPTIASKAENRPYIFEGVYYARNLMLLNKLRADNDMPPFSHIPARCQTIEDKERWLINQDSTDDLKI